MHFLLSLWELFVPLSMLKVQNLKDCGWNLINLGLSSFLSSKWFTIILSFMNLKFYHNMFFFMCI